MQIVDDIATCTGVVYDRDKKGKLLLAVSWVNDGGDTWTTTFAVDEAIAQPTVDAIDVA